MKLRLEVTAGDDAGRRVEVRDGSMVRVGRDAPCELPLRGDSLLSNPHFAIAVEGSAARLRDLGSRFGTFRNGERITECELRDGDRLRAGRTEFLVRLEAVAPAGPPGETAEVAAAQAKPAAAPLPSGPPARELLRFLRGTPNLFALLDAAREATIPHRLAEAGVRHESLYEGDAGLAIAHYGPWLAEVPAESTLLASLARHGWGHAWGVYLTSDQPFEEVRHHLRRFLTVTLPGAKAAYFRYYDPRVLRVYLPTCTPQESETFFGPVRAYLCEDGSAGELLLFTREQRDAVRFPVTGAVAAAAV